MRIDATGKQCPIPVIMAKKELDNGAQDVEIVVDGQVQVDNLARLGDSIGRPITSEDFEGKKIVKFANGETKNAGAATADGSYAVFEVGAPCEFVILYKKIPVAVPVLISLTALMFIGAGLVPVKRVRTKHGRKKEEDI